MNKKIDEALQSFISANPLKSHKHFGGITFSVVDAEEEQIKSNTIFPFSSACLIQLFVSSQDFGLNLIALINI